MCSSCSVRSGLAQSLVRKFCLFLALAGLVFAIHNGDLLPKGTGVPLTATSDEMIAHFGGSDYATYLRGALVLRDEGLSAYADKGFKNFAPGLSTLQIPLIALEKVLPVSIGLLLVGLILWACAFDVMAQTIRSLFLTSSVLSYASVLALFAAPFFYNALLWDGVLLSETVSTPFFLMGCAYTARLAWQKEQHIVRQSVIAGLMFAAASYLRAQYDIIFVVLLLAMAVSFWAVRLTLKFRPTLKLPLSSWGRTLLFLFVAYAAATVPYRVAIKSPALVVNDYVWKLVWHDKDFFEKAGGGFILSGGGGVLCEVNAQTCTDFMARENAGNKPKMREARKAAIATVFDQPVTYFSQKLPYFYYNWFDDFASCSNYGSCAPQYLNKPMLFLFPGVFLFIATFSEKKRKLINMAIFSVFAGSLAIGSLGFSLFIHVEPLYMLPLKLFVLLSEAVVLAACVEKLWQRRKSQDYKKVAS